MSNKSKRKEAPQTFRQKYGLLILVSGWFLLSSSVMLIDLAGRAKLFDVLYPVSNADIWDYLFLIILIITPLSAFIILMKSIVCIVSNRNVKKWIQVFIVTILCVFVTAIMLFPPGSSTKIVDIVHREVFRDHVYYVSQLIAIDGPLFGYGIYECDQLEIRCVLLYQSDGTVWIQTAFVNTSDEAIIFEITGAENGLITYTHQPD